MRKNRPLVLALLLAFLLALAGCASTDVDAPMATSAPGVPTTASASATPEPAPAATETPAASAEPSGSPDAAEATQAP